MSFTLSLRDIAFLSQGSTALNATFWMSPVSDGPMIVQVEFVNGIAQFTYPADFSWDLIDEDEYALGSISSLTGGIGWTEDGTITDI